MKKGFDTYQNHDNQQANVSTQHANVANAKAGVKVAKANIEAQQATVNRLRTVAEFESVRNLDGVVTVRNIDVGDSSTPIPAAARRCSGTWPSCAYPSTYPRSWRLPCATGSTQGPGVRAAGRTFVGKVARSAGALLSSSRTLSVEVDVDNAGAYLRAGLFVNVSFAIPREHPNVVVPAEALIFNQQGLRVAVINEDKSVHMQPVTVYRTSAATIELSDGLRGGENIVLSPPTSLQEGGKVKVTSEQKVADAAR